MKYSITNLLLLTALIAALMGWFCDHRRLENDKERLNSEAVNLFNRLSIATSGSTGRPVPPGWAPRSYNHSIEQDRADWLKDHPSSFFGGLPYDRSEDNSDAKKPSQ